MTAALAALLGACAGGPDSAPPLDISLTELPLRDDAHRVLVPGEEATYGVSWAGVLPVGRVSYRYDEIETREGRFLVYEGTTQPLLPVEAFLKAAGTIRTLADPDTFLPVASFWVTAAEDPDLRTTVFRQEDGTAYGGKWASDFVTTRTVRGAPMVDPISAVFIGRLVDVRPGNEVRVLLVEGSALHLMTVRHAGEEEIVHQGERIPCTVVSLRADKLDEDGTLAGGERSSDLLAWVAERPHRPILRISGDIRLGSVVLNLARYTVPEPSG